MSNMLKAYSGFSSFLKTIPAASKNESRFHVCQCPTGPTIKHGGKGTEQPSVTGSAWPQGSWEGVYLKIPTGSSSISLWLQIRANWGREGHASKWSSWGQMLTGLLQRGTPKAGVCMFCSFVSAPVQVPVGPVTIWNVQCIKSIMLHTSYLESRCSRVRLSPQAPSNRSPSWSKSTGRRCSLFLCSLSSWVFPESDLGLVQS